MRENRVIAYVYIARRGYTVVEMMVTILIVAVLLATVGTFFVKLLTLQENQREEAYIKEKLADICANISDYMSIGTNVVGDMSKYIVCYRYETGGVSFETGRVLRVAQMQVSLNTNAPNNTISPTTMDLDVFAFKQGSPVLDNKFSRNFCADDTPLVPLSAIKELRLRNNAKVDLSYQIVPMNSPSLSLWNLRIVARYEVGDVKKPIREVSVERIVRLWNRQ